MADPLVATYSIVGCDLGARQWGVAVQSKFLAVGSVVPWAQANVGAIATQAASNVGYGPQGLEMLRKGATARHVVETLTAADPDRDVRQVGVVDAKGGSASYTGSKCLPWAGHRTGPGYACQGNILFGEEVVKGMVRSFESTPGDLPERLLAALAAGQREGGDRRGMQSAALLIVKERGGYDEGSDRWVDIRVDDHPSPIEELRRVFRLYDLVMLSREDPATLVTITPEIARVVQHHLSVLGYYNGHLNGEWSAPTVAAFEKFINEHNFERKSRKDRTVWPSILDYLQTRAQEEAARRTQTAPIVPNALERGPGGGSAVSKATKGTDPSSG
jgi:uncharacterized Ntn-hydrolase superfamily protein